MKKTGLTLIMLFLGIGILFSQTSFVHRNIGLDSLVVLMQRVSKEKIYYMGDEGAKNLTFTVNVGSTTLLDDIKDQLKEKGYTIGNVDATVCAEQPKLNPHIPAMKSVLAPLMNIDEEDVSIKATTTEQLGFTGRKEGISAYAVVLIEKL